MRVEMNGRSCCIAIVHPCALESLLAVAFMHVTPSVQRGAASACMYGSSMILGGMSRDDRRSHCGRYRQPTCMRMCGKLCAGVGLTE